MLSARATAVATAKAVWRIICGSLINVFGSQPLVVLLSGASVTDTSFFTAGSSRSLLALARYRAKKYKQTSWHTPQR